MKKIFLVLFMALVFAGCEIYTPAEHERELLKLLGPVSVENAVIAEIIQEEMVTESAARFVIVRHNEGLTRVLVINGRRFNVGEEIKITMLLYKNNSITPPGYVFVAE